MGLQKYKQIFEEVPVNVYNIFTKKIVFTGSQRRAARFLNIQGGLLSWKLKSKRRINDEFAVRIKSIKS